MSFEADPSYLALLRENIVANRASNVQVLASV